MQVTKFEKEMCLYTYFPFSLFLWRFKKKNLAPEAAVVAKRNLLKYTESQNVRAGRDTLWGFVTENTGLIVSMII